jgi:hypothetical protein
MSISAIVFLVIIIVRLIRYYHYRHRPHWKPNALKISDERYKRYKALHKIENELR